MRLILASIAFASLAAVAGCGQSKVAQCNAFIDEANKGQNAFEKVDLVGGTPEVVKKALDEARASNQALLAVKLTDTKLVELRAQYVKTHEEAANVMQSAPETRVNAEKADDATAKKLQDDLQNRLDRTVKDSEKVIDALNVYCTGLK